MRLDLRDPPLHHDVTVKPVARSLSWGNLAITRGVRRAVAGTPSQINLGFISGMTHFSRNFTFDGFKNDIIPSLRPTHTFEWLS